MWHSPDREDEAAEARRLGGLRRRREKIVAGAYDFEGLDSVQSIRRLVEIAAIDLLGLEISIVRSRTWVPTRIRLLGRTVGSATASALDCASALDWLLTDVDGPLLGDRWLIVGPMGVAPSAQPRRDRLIRRFALRGVLFFAIAELTVLALAGVPVVVSGAPTLGVSPAARPRSERPPADADGLCVHPVKR